MQRFMHAWYETGFVQTMTMRSGKIKKEMICTSFVGDEEAAECPVVVGSEHDTHRVVIGHDARIRFAAEHLHFRHHSVHSYKCSTQTFSTLCAEAENMGMGMVWCCLGMVLRHKTWRCQMASLLTQGVSSAPEMFCITKFDSHFVINEQVSSQNRKTEFLPS